MPGTLETPAGDAERERIWRERYDRELRSVGANTPESLLSGHDRRRFPRVSFPPGTQVFIEGEATPHDIHDISAGGVSYLSDVRVRPGSVVTLNAQGILSLPVVIRGCDLEETDANLMEYRYRVHAQFLPGVDGYQAFVLVREILGRIQKPTLGTGSPTDA